MEVVISIFRVRIDTPPFPHRRSDALQLFRRTDSVTTAAILNKRNRIVSHCVFAIDVPLNAVEIDVDGLHPGGCGGGGVGVRCVLVVCR